VVGGEATLRRYDALDGKQWPVPDGEEVMTTLVGTPDLNTLDRHESFAALFDAHYPAVLAYCRRRAAHDDAGDAALATFEALWRSMAEPPAQPLPWLYRVAAGQLANSRRSERRRLRLIDRLSGRNPGAGPSDPAVTTTEGVAARAALARLRPADREVLLLVAWEGLATDEAAATLGLTPATFAVRLHRARQRLEALLADHPPPLAPEKDET
jgi:RNA polymerase sigma-70 factor (ECF subfamily)